MRCRTGQCPASASCDLGATHTTGTMPPAPVPGAGAAPTYAPDTRGTERATNTAKPGSE